MKRREETAPKAKKGLGSAKTISNLLSASKKQKVPEGAGYGSDEFIDYDQKFGPKRKRVIKNKRDLLPFKHRALEFMSNSSLFCFHKYGKTRKAC